jgi:hypothetical protein
VFVKAAQDLNLSKEHELSAHQLHTDLFLSGIERILLVTFSRKGVMCSLADSCTRMVDCAQGIDDILPYSASRDFPLCCFRGSGSVRAAVDALAPHRPTTCWTSPHYEDDNSSPLSTVSQGGACAPISAPHGATKDRLERETVKQRTLERWLRTELCWL